MEDYLEELIESLSKLQSKEKFNVLKGDEIKTVADDSERRETDIFLEYVLPEDLTPLEKFQNFAEQEDSYEAPFPLPFYLCIRKSDNHEAGYGIWTNNELPEGTRFGPYEDSITSEFEEEFQDDYCSEISFGKEMMDSKDKYHSNWLRFINYACSEEEQNLIAFPIDDQIYYYTIKTIPPETELLVWFSDEYANEFGIGWESIGYWNGWH